jgi:hypothetical protein
VDGIAHIQLIGAYPDGPAYFADHVSCIGTDHAVVQAIAARVEEVATAAQRLRLQTDKQVMGVAVFWLDHE